MTIKLSRHRRPLYVTPWGIRIKWGLKIPYNHIAFYKDHGTDEQGRQRIQIVDEMDREYWVRLSRFQYRLFAIGNQ